MSKLIYLDNSATSYPKPPEVYDFMHEFYMDNGVNPGRSGYDKSLEAEEMVYATRKMLTEYFNGINPNYLTFSYNASEYDHPGDGFQRGSCDHQQPGTQFGAKAPLS
jgi:selenocysteine lyase/cysteine desulfurase